MSAGVGVRDRLADLSVPTGLLVWNTGLQPNEFCIGLQGVSKDPRTKSLRVDEHLHVLDDSGKPMPSVYAIGDNAMTGEGHRLPATAQVASQMATYTAKSLNGGDVRPEPFKWKNYGSMVFIGDYRVSLGCVDVLVDPRRPWWTDRQQTLRGPDPGWRDGLRGSYGGESLDLEEELLRDL